MDTSPTSLERVGDPKRNGSAHVARARVARLAAGLIVGAAIGSPFVEVPYYSLGAGRVVPTKGLVQVGRADVYAPAGGVSFATVAVKGRLSAWGLLRSWIDSSREVVPESLLLQGRSTKQNDQVNEQLMTSSKDVAVQVAFGYLGKRENIGAALVSVVADSPAQRGGFAVGDLITGIDDVAVHSSTDLVREIANHKAGDAIRIDRVPAAGAGADVLTASAVVVILGSHRERPGAGFFGVEVQTRTRAELPIDVGIDSGEVAGPSAGLAFALGVIDMLTPGELTGGQPVAVTGTLNLDGTVGPIGGLDHKVDAVRSAGVKLFLVPASQSPAELAKARRRAGSAVDLVTVANVEEALGALRDRGGEAFRPIG